MIKAADYISFLSKKHKNQKTIDERTEFINQMQQFFTENSLAGTAENIDKFFIRVILCTIILFILQKLPSKKQIFYSV